LNRCLALARQISTPEEMDVLMGKLSGVPAAEIARSIGATEAAVDHRFRNALARLRSAIEGGKGGFRDG
jgi:DNA-directed RNA polymerase specialized sigma24 family protein